MHVISIDEYDKWKAWNFTVTKQFVTIYKQCTCKNGECVCYQLCRYGITLQIK